MMIKRIERRTAVLCAVLVMLPLPGLLSVGAESISGVVNCLDKDLAVSVTSERGEFGPFPITDGEFLVELPDGVRSGKLVFHKYSRRLEELFADRDRPTSELDGYHTNVSFDIPQGSNHLDVGQLSYAIVTFDVTIPQTGALQVALFRDGWKNYGTRRMEFPSDYRISYLVSPPASVQLRLLYDDSAGLTNSQLESDTIEVMRWDVHYHAAIPAVE